MRRTNVVWREFRTYFKSIWLIIAPILLIPLLFFGKEGKCAYCVLLMSCYWIAEVAPLAATSFLPLFILPVLGVIGIKEIAGSYLTDTNVLFIASLMLSLAVEECKLHRRIALKMLTFVGAKPQWLIAGFIMTTSFISMWISDTACAALMAPIAYALLEVMMIPKMTSVTTDGNAAMPQNHDYETSSLNSPKLDLTRLSEKDRGFCKCLMLVVAHASLIGGTGTINGTGPNLIFKDMLERFYPGENTGISYLTWMAFSIPPMFVYMFASWFIVQVRFLGIRHMLNIFKSSTDEERIDERTFKEALRTAYEKLGPMTFAEKSTLVIFVLTVVSWMTSDPKVVDGWKAFFKSGYVTDACPGMLAVFVLFVFPRQSPDFVYLRPRSERLRPSQSREALLSWDAVKRRFPWSVILLLGAGFAISKSVTESGLSVVIACKLERLLSSFPVIVMQAVISASAAVMTEFSTNSATASILIPIAFALGQSVRSHPLYFSIPVAIIPSFAFSFPMATPANAIVYDYDVLRMADMVSCGLFLDIACICITLLNVNTWVHWLFAMGTYPEYALSHNSTTNCF